MRGVESDFVGDLRPVRRAEPPACKVAVSRLLPLHGDEAARQPPAEQPGIEEIVSLVGTGVFLEMLESETTGDDTAAGIVIAGLFLFQRARPRS